MELWRFSEDELIERIESLADAGPDSEALMSSLDELFRRMLDEANPDDRDYVEAVIAHISRTFSQPDDDEPGLDGTGVREPRRPAPQAGSAAAAVDLGRYDEAA